MLTEVHIKKVYSRGCATLPQVPRDKVREEDKHLHIYIGAYFSLTSQTVLWLRLSKIPRLPNLFIHQKAYICAKSNDLKDGHKESMTLFVFFFQFYKAITWNNYRWAIFIWQYSPVRKQTRVHLIQRLHFIGVPKKAKPEEQNTSCCKVDNGNESTSTPTSTASSSYIPAEG